MVRDLLIKDRRLHNRETLVAKIPKPEKCRFACANTICRYKILRLRGANIDRGEKKIFVHLYRCQKRLDAIDER